jgi:hypothetical protein
MGTAAAALKTSTSVDWKAIVSSPEPACEHIKGILSSGRATAEEAFTAIELMSKEPCELVRLFEVAQAVVDHDGRVAERALKWAKDTATRHELYSRHEFLYSSEPVCALLSSILKHAEAASSNEADETVASILASGSAPKSRNALVAYINIACAGLGKLIKAKPDNYVLTNAALLPIVEAITYPADWWVRERGYYALDAVIDNAGRLDAPFLIPAMAQAIDMEEEQDRRIEGQIRPATRMLALRRYKLTRILKMQPHMLDAGTLVLCAKAGRQGAEAAEKIGSLRPRASANSKPPNVLVLQ